MSAPKPQLLEVNGMWVVRVPQEKYWGTQEYRCSSEKQARQLFALLCTEPKSPRRG